jgi:ABC-type transport system involved in cytochrome bd biosynthesis fused ATPase/permease subunit
MRRVTRQRWTSIGLNVLAVGLAFVSAQVAVALYLVVSTVLLVVPLLGMRRHRQQRRAR